MEEAVTAIEETNRVIGLSRLVQKACDSDQTTLAVMEALKQSTAGQDDAGPYLVWGFA